jgi:hypothetical protein
MIEITDTDVEPCRSANHTRLSTERYVVANQTKDCAVWPGRQTILEKHRMMKKRRGGCNPMRNLNKRTKIWIKIIIALFIVGSAVGIGIGVSKAVGGGVWKTANSQTQIGSGNGARR